MILVTLVFDMSAEVSFWESQMARWGYTSERGFYQRLSEVPSFLLVETISKDSGG